MNVRRSEVSGRGEVPGVGANLDGEGSGVTKVENHGLRGVHPPARLDLSVLYGGYRFADGLEDRLQFVLGAGWADYLGVFSATHVFAVHLRSSCAPPPSPGRPPAYYSRTPRGPGYTYRCPGPL